MKLRAALFAVALTAVTGAAFAAAPAAPAAVPTAAAPAKTAVVKHHPRHKHVAKVNKASTKVAAAPEAKKS